MTLHTLDTTISSGTEMLEKEVQERLNMAEIMRIAAEEASIKKSAFLSSVSHELRTPLTAILGLAEQALQWIDEGEINMVKKFLKRIVTNAEHQTDLINDILDLSKIEAGRMEYHWEKKQLQEIVYIVVDELKPVAEKKFLTIGVYDNIGPNIVQYDSLKLGRVIQNLLGNAIKFSKPETEIKISIWQDTENLGVSVSNYGTLIPSSELTKIFEPFVQSSETNKTSGGTGLGLALCKKIITDHHGEIWAECDGENQVSFTFVIPKGELT